MSQRHIITLRCQNTVLHLLCWRSWVTVILKGNHVTTTHYYTAMSRHCFASSLLEAVSLFKTHSIKTTEWIKTFPEPRRLKQPALEPSFLVMSSGEPGSPCIPCLYTNDSTPHQSATLGLLFSYRAYIFHVMKQNLRQKLMTVILDGSYVCRTKAPCTRHLDSSSQTRFFPPSVQAVVLHMLDPASSSSAGMTCQRPHLWYHSNVHS